MKPAIYIMVKKRPGRSAQGIARAWDERTCDDRIDQTLLTEARLALSKGTSMTKAGRETTDET